MDVSRMLPGEVVSRRQHLPQPNQERMGTGGTPEARLREKVGELEAPGQIRSGRTLSSYARIPGRS